MKLLLALLVVGLLGGVGYLLVGWEGGSGDLVGPAQVVDADTLTVAGTRIRLSGVDAPEASQTCEREGADWACGREATAALRAFLAARQVRCIPEDTDRFGRVVARCEAGGEDIGAWLVREGWAVAYTRFTWRYVPQEWLAWWEGRGLWAGRFVAPEEWRRGER